MDQSFLCPVSPSEPTDPDESYTLPPFVFLSLTRGNWDGKGRRGTLRLCSYQSKTLGILVLFSDKDPSTP